MRALILAGGYGTRLWPVTRERAKPLLPLAGVSLLDYILDEIEQIERMGRIYVTTNERFKDSFKDYLARRGDGRYELVIEEQKEEEEKYGAVGGIMNVIGSEEGDDYLVIGGDNYYSFKIKDFIDFSLEKESITNACFRVKSLEEAKNYGIVNFDQNKKIIDFQEKPKNPSSRMASTACYYFPEERLEIFREYADFWEGKIPEEVYLDEPGRFIEWTVENYDIYAYPFEGKWMDIGTRAGYLRAESELREESIVRGNIVDSEIGDDVTILEGTEVSDSKIENSIIFENCVIKNSVIADSIVGDNTEVRDIEIGEGLIKEIK